MTDRNTQEAVVVRVIDQFWNGQALERIGEVFTDDAVIHFGATDYVGHAGIIEEFARPFMAAFPDLKHDILALLIDGDRAAMRYRGTGHMQKDYGGARAAGQPFEYHGIAIFRVDEGRVAEVWSNSDMANWLAAQPRA
jgi:predicted ester cyclase